MSDCEITPIDFINYNLYVIYSDLSVSTLRDELNSVDLSEYSNGKPNVGLMHIDYKDGKETNRTIAVLSRHLYAYLEENGFTENHPDNLYRVKPYIAQNPEKVRPRKDQKYEFYIHYPVKYETTNEEVISRVKQILSHYGEFSNFFNAENINVHIPIRVRNLEPEKRFVLVKFYGPVRYNYNAIIAARLILHNHRWTTSSSELVNCVWVKSKPERVDKRESREEPVQQTVPAQSENRFDDLSEVNC